MDPIWKSAILSINRYETVGMTMVIIWIPVTCSDESYNLQVTMNPLVDCQVVLSADCGDEEITISDSSSLKINCRDCNWGNDVDIRVINDENLHLNLHS